LFSFDADVEFVSVCR